MLCVTTSTWDTHTDTMSVCTTVNLTRCLNLLLQKSTPNSYQTSWYTRRSVIVSEHWHPIANNHANWLPRPSTLCHCTAIRQWICSLWSMASCITLTPFRFPPMTKASINPEESTQQKTGWTPWPSKDIVTGQKQFHVAFSNGLCTRINWQLWFILMSQIVNPGTGWYTWATLNTIWTMYGHQIQFDHRVSIF